MAIADEMSAISENVFLSGIKGLTLANLNTHRITCVINACEKQRKYAKQELECVHIAIADERTADISPYFDFVADKMNQVLEKGGNVVVHCVSGISRSPTLVIAFLIKYRMMTLHESFNFVHSKRSIIRPNNGFFKQLIEFESKILGSKSVQMIKIRREPRDGHCIEIEIPDFFESEYTRKVRLELFIEFTKQNNLHKNDES
ncbi:dual specificity protein phosphatase 14-like protein [Dinothrombium tinctorium]|uniref:Dual specificity protein phosphatase 14-like protein n=1 Tax=Dinothrombium tinctorium TaxID=1965070 RepID=A0A3S3P979_9ACAR|nr:dual specificity protein phosphatase 14-like protein [Dinothrombium tinctorium]RWS10205.1 dual specificity protein phosphatase 14-like protein [Dinothrombium tinctorium]RWS10560.1 dual specificity protein phosphatase 14-like protein [Dinothrombium tinctorium]